MEKSDEKQKVNKIFLPFNMTRINSIKNNIKKSKNFFGSHNNLSNKGYHKSPTCDINLNKSMAIINNKILKTEEGINNKNINFEHRRIGNLFIKKSKKI